VLAYVYIVVQVFLSYTDTCLHLALSCAGATIFFHLYLSTFLSPDLGVSGQVVECRTRNFQATGSNLTACH